MTRGLPHLIFCTLSALWSGGPAAAGEPGVALRARLATAGPGDRIRVIAYYHEAKPVQAPEPRLLAGALRARAELAERPIRQALAAHDASRIHSLWALRALAFEATPAAILRITARPDISRVDEDILFQGETAPLLRAPKSTESVPWNLERIGANALWAEGRNGTGVTVGVIDTGVDASHPDIAGKMVPDGWRDFVSALPSPYDDHGHGTHITGTICGGTVSGTAIGVAPGARFLSAKALDSANRFYFSWVAGAGQWLADPNGDGDSSDAPDVVNCSWLFDNVTFSGYRPILELWRAAGIWPAFAGGNRGPGAYSVGSPGSDPLAISVGMTNAFDLVADGSSRGPAPDMSPFDGALKPDVTAPGVSIRSSVPGGGYGFWTGTSMATPHVAGTLALMKQALPSIGYEEAYMRLTLTATDKGLPGPDTAYGHGLIHAHSAINMVEGFVPPAISGIVRDAGGNPLPYALVDASGTRTVAGPDGRFSIPHVEAPSVSVTVDAPGFAPLTKMVATGAEEPFVLMERVEPVLVNGDMEQVGSWTPSVDSGVLTRTNVANRTPGGAWALEVAANGFGEERYWRSENVPVSSGGLASLNVTYAWRATGSATGRMTAIEWLDSTGRILITDFGTPFSPHWRSGPADGVWRTTIQAFHAAPPAGASWVRLRLGAIFATNDMTSRMWFDDAAMDISRAAGTGAVAGTVTHEGVPLAGAIVGEHPFGTYFAPADMTGRYVLVLPEGLQSISAWSPGTQPSPSAAVQVSAGETADSSDFDLVPGGRNIAPSGTHAASSTLDAAYGPQFAADDIALSAWMSAVGGGATPDTPVWWSVNALATRELQSVEIEWESEPSNVRVSVSTNGTVWTPVAQGDGYGWRQDEVRTISALRLHGVSARHLRVEDIGSNLTGRMGLWEVRLHAAPSTLPGDVDDSGAVTVADAATVLRAAGGLGDTALLFSNGDVAPAGGDGFLTLHDAIAVARISSGTLAE